MMTVTDPMTTSELSGEMILMQAYYRKLSEMWERFHSRGYISIAMEISDSLNKLNDAAEKINNLKRNDD